MFGMMLLNASHFSLRCEVDSTTPGHTFLARAVFRKATPRGLGSLAELSLHTLRLLSMSNGEFAHEKLSPLAGAK